MSFFGGSGVYHCEQTLSSLSHSRTARRRQLSGAFVVKETKATEKLPVIRSTFYAEGSSLPAAVSAVALGKYLISARPTRTRSGEISLFPLAATQPEQTLRHCRDVPRKNQRECCASFARRKSTAMAISASGLSPTSRSIVKNPSKPAAFSAGR